MRASRRTAPIPERFTIREVVAHLADWEPLSGFHSLNLTHRLREDRPVLENLDEGEFAIRNRYHETNVAERLVRFAIGRAALVEMLKAISPEDWERVGLREWGALSIDGFAAMILGHDGYHMEQVIVQRGTL